MHPSDPLPDAAATTGAALASAEPTAPPPRRRRVERDQLIRARRLADLLPADHQARVGWPFVQGVELTALDARLRSGAGGPGRPAIAPRLLVAGWLDATLAGVGSARALDSRCVEQHACRWLTGGGRGNAHTPSDCRVAHRDLLDDLLTHSVATLRAQDLVARNCVAQDGRRVRASAGAAAFRRRPPLAQCVPEAGAPVRRRRAAGADAPGPGQRRKAKAPARVARERAQRLRPARQRLPEWEAKQKAADQATARRATTAPAATVLKMAAGGGRPAYPVPCSTATSTPGSVGVDVLPHGSDQGQLPPLVEQLHARFAPYPQAALGAGGFATHADSDTVSAAAKGCTV